MEHDATINDGPGATVVLEDPLPGAIDLPGNAAARKFANTAELVIMMSDHIPGQDLPRLCLVNSNFNALFSPLLYRHIRLNKRFLLPKHLAWVAGNPRFRHTKILTFEKTGGLTTGQYLSEERRALVQRTATDVLRLSSTLHTIYLDGTFIGSDKVVSIIANGLDGKFKRSSANLQCLALNLNATPCRELSASLFHKHSLKSLHLNEIPTASWSVGLLCQALKDSPALRYLKLSYLNGTENQWTLEEICKQYNQLGGAPLELEFVMLGRGVGLSLPDEVFSSAGAGSLAQASYFSLLADPTCVRDMRITATNKTAWGTIDSSFFPNMTRLRLSSSTWLETRVRNFFAMPRTRDFLRQVHLEVDGTLFDNTKYEEFKDMTRRFFRLYDLSDPTSRLAPMGFSFHSQLQSEASYQRSIALPLPNTLYLDITIHYNHLVGFSGIGLSKMPALECLSLNIYVYNTSEWDDSDVVGEKQLKALGKAAKSCPNLRYARMKMCAIGPQNASIAGLSCSWEIFRVRRPRFKHPQPVFRLLNARDDKLLRPQSMWTGAEKRAKYVKEDLDKLGYDKPLWKR